MGGADYSGYAGRDSKQGTVLHGSEGIAEHVKPAKDRMLRLTPVNKDSYRSSEQVKFRHPGKPGVQVVDSSG